MIFKILVLCYLISSVYPISEYPILIVVSYDGFGYDFFQRNVNPHMINLRKLGTYTDYMKNVFPTKTFPNHHSIATGLFAETHGVIGNHEYNSETNMKIEYGYEMFHYDENILPIWSLNEKAANDRHSGIMMWPGGNMPYQGINATYTSSWLSGFDYYKRIEIVISWLKDPVKPANLIMLYFEEPDAHEHIYGPNSEVVDSFLQLMDNVTLYLHEQLELNGLSGKVNVIHLSDHGMSSVIPSHFLNLTEYLDPDMYISSGSSPGVHIFPKPGREEYIHNRLRRAEEELGHFKVYTKDSIPGSWHFKNNRLVPPLFLCAEDTYAFQDLAYTVYKRYNVTVTPTSRFGLHGYDNNNSNMWPFFMARGPKIKKNHKIPPFNTVDLFNIFCEILEIVPVGNNGSFANVKDMLVEEGRFPDNDTILVTVGLLLVGFTITLVSVVVYSLMKYQQRLRTAAALNKRFPQTAPHSTETERLLSMEEII